MATRKPSNAQVARRLVQGFFRGDDPLELFLALGADDDEQPGETIEVEAEVIDERPNAK